MCVHTDKQSHVAQQPKQVEKSYFTERYDVTAIQDIMILGFF